MAQRRKARIAAAALALTAITGAGLAQEQLVAHAWPWEVPERHFGSIENFEWSCADAGGRTRRVDRYTLYCFAERDYGPLTFELVEFAWHSDLADPNAEYGGGGGSW